MVWRRVLGVLACCLAVLATAATARADVVDDVPAVAAQGTGEMRAFIRGSDGALWTRTWDGTNWTGWSSLGGVLTSGPAASVRPGGIYDVVARGTNGSYYHRAFTPAAGWSDWVSLDGGFLSAPSVTYRQQTGQIDVVGVGLDRALYHNSWEPGSGWTGWGDLGGSLSGNPSVISPGPQVVDIYARGSDGQLWHKYWTPQTNWAGYFPLGGALSSGVAATAWDPNRRDVFARGTDGAIWIKTWTNTGSWAPWARLGGGPSSGPGATAPGPNRLIVFARAGASVMADAFSSTWTGWRSFGPAPVYTPPPPPPPPATVPGPAPGSSLTLNAGFGCIPQGGRVPVRLRIRQRTGRLKPRVKRVVFFVDAGKRRRVDHHAPYRTRIRVTYRRGSK